MLNDIIIATLPMFLTQENDELDDWITYYFEWANRSWLLQNLL